MREGGSLGIGLGMANGSRECSRRVTMWMIYRKEVSDFKRNLVGDYFLNETFILNQGIKFITRSDLS